MKRKYVIIVALVLFLGTTLIMQGRQAGWDTMHATEAPARLAPFAVAVAPKATAVGAYLVVAVTVGFGLWYAYATRIAQAHSRTSSDAVADLP
jgi:hypothetical protein